MQRQTVNKLKKIYYDVSSPAAFAGANRVYKEAKKQGIKNDQVKEFLEHESAYTLYRPARKRFKRLATIPTGLNSDWQCDLAIMDSLSKNNDGFKYMLVCIDVLSRKMYVAPVKSKSPKHMKEAFKKIFQKSQERPSKLYSDRGLEFQAKEMLKYFQENFIDKRVVYSPDIHAGVVERANRTIKERLYRYFHKNKTHRWVDVIDDIVNDINNSINRTIGKAPNEIDHKNAKEILERVFSQAQGNEPKFKVGDKVRISKDKGVFGKGYHPSYTDEVFIINAVKNTNPPHYKLIDKNGEEIMGVFYEPELSFVRGDQLGSGFKPTLWQKTI